MYNFPTWSEMAQEDKPDFIEAVVTCEGNLHDPDFSTKFQIIVDNLKELLYTREKENEDLFHIRKIEPWNSVRVTISIPKEAAQRLKLLAQQGSNVLRQLGILSVQVEGDQVISLTLAGSNNEPTQVILQHASSTDQPTASSSTSSMLSGNFLVPNVNNTLIQQKHPTPPTIPLAIAGPSGVRYPIEIRSSPSSSPFRSPNVVAPGGESIPCFPQKIVSLGLPPRLPLAGPFPFASMTHAAAHTMQRSETNPNSTQGVGDNSNSTVTNISNRNNSTNISSNNSVSPMLNSGKINVGNVYVIGKSTNILQNRSPLLHNVQQQGTSSTPVTGVLLGPQGGIVKSDGTRFLYNNNLTNSSNSNNAISQANSIILSSSSSQASSSLGANQSLQIQLVNTRNAPVPPPPYPHNQQIQHVTTQQIRQQQPHLVSHVAGSQVADKPVSSPLLVNLLQHGDTNSSGNSNITNVPPSRTQSASNQQSQEQMSMPPPPLAIPTSTENQQYYRRYQQVQEQQQQKLKRTMSLDAPVHQQQQQQPNNNHLLRDILPFSGSSQASNNSTATYSTVLSSPSRGPNNNEHFQFSMPMPLPCDVPNNSRSSADLQQQPRMTTIFHQNQNTGSFATPTTTTSYRVMNPTQILAFHQQQQQQQNQLRTTIRLQQEQQHNQTILSPTSCSQPQQSIPHQQMHNPAQQSFMGQNIVHFQNQPQQPRAQQLMMNGPLPVSSITSQQLSSSPTIAQTNPNAPSFFLHTSSDNNSLATPNASSSGALNNNNMSHNQQFITFATTTTTAINSQGNVYRTATFSPSNANIATAMHVTKIPVQQAMSTLADQQQIHSFIPISTVSMPTSLSKSAIVNTNLPFATPNAPAPTIVTHNPTVSFSNSSVAGRGLIFTQHSQILGQNAETQKQPTGLSEVATCSANQSSQFISNTVLASSAPTSVLSIRNRGPSTGIGIPPQGVAGTGKPRLLLINPLTGHLEPMASDTSSGSDDDDYPNKHVNSRRGLGKGKPAEALASGMANILGKQQPTTLSEQTKKLQKQISLLQQREQHLLLQQQQHRLQQQASLSSTASATPVNVPVTVSPGGRKMSSDDNVFDSATYTNANIINTGEKIKLRLKLEKVEPIMNPAYKVDISFLKKEEKMNSSSSYNSSVSLPNVSVGAAPAYTTLSGSTSNTLPPQSSEGNTPSSIDPPRVPPLHISLRGKNAAVVMSPRTDDKESTSSTDNIPPLLVPTTITGKSWPELPYFNALCSTASESVKTGALSHAGGIIPVSNASGKSRAKSRFKSTDSAGTSFNEIKIKISRPKHSRPAENAEKKSNKNIKYVPGKIRAKSASFSSSSSKALLGGETSQLLHGLDPNFLPKKAKKSRRKSEHQTAANTTATSTPVQAQENQDKIIEISEPLKMEHSELHQLLTDHISLEVTPKIDDTCVKTIAAADPDSVSLISQDIDMKREPINSNYDLTVCDNITDKFDASLGVSIPPNSSEFQLTASTNIEKFVELGSSTNTHISKDTEPCPMEMSNSTVSCSEVSDSVNNSYLVLDKGDSMSLPGVFHKPTPIVPTKANSEPNGGNGNTNAAGEDSGIDSMDALSEKSPNQGESPVRKDIELTHDKPNYYMCHSGSNPSTLPQEKLIGCAEVVQIGENSDSTADRKSFTQYSGEMLINSGVQESTELKERDQALKWVNLTELSETPDTETKTLATSALAESILESNTTSNPEIKEESVEKMNIQVENNHSDKKEERSDNILIDAHSENKVESIEVPEIAEFSGEVVITEPLESIVQLEDAAEIVVAEASDGPLQNQEDESGKQEFPEITVTELELETSENSIVTVDEKLVVNAKEGLAVNQTNTSHFVEASINMPVGIQLETPLVTIDECPEKIKLAQDLPESKSISEELDDVKVEEVITEIVDQRCETSITDINEERLEASVSMTKTNDGRFDSSVTEMAVDGLQITTTEVRDEVQAIKTCEPLNEASNAKLEQNIVQVAEEKCSQSETIDESGEKDSTEENNAPCITASINDSNLTETIEEMSEQHINEIIVSSEQPAVPEQSGLVTETETSQRTEIMDEECKQNVTETKKGDLEVVEENCSQVKTEIALTNIQPTIISSEICELETEIVNEKDKVNVIEIEADTELQPDSDVVEAIKEKYMESSIQIVDDKIAESTMKIAGETREDNVLEEANKTCEQMDITVVDVNLEGTVTSIVQETCKQPDDIIIEESHSPAALVVPDNPITIDKIEIMKEVKVIGKIPTTQPIRCELLVTECEKQKENEQEPQPRTLVPSEPVEARQSIPVILPLLTPTSIDVKANSIPVSFLPRMENPHLKQRPLLRPTMHTSPVLLRPKLFDSTARLSVGLRAADLKSLPKLHPKPEDRLNREPIRIFPMHQEAFDSQPQQPTSGMQTIPNAISLNFTRNSGISLPNVIQITRASGVPTTLIQTRVSSPVVSSSNSPGLVSISVTPNTSSVATTKATLFTIHPNSQSNLSQQIHHHAQQHSHQSVTVLPSGHKVVPIKLVTIPRQNQAQPMGSLMGAALNRSSSNVFEAVKHSAFRHVRSSNPTHATPLSVSAMQMGMSGGGNLTLVPISAVPNIGHIHGQQNPVKLLVSSPMKMQPNLMKSVVVKSVVMGNPNTLNLPRATAIRVIGPPNQLSPNPSQVSQNELSTSPSLGIQNDHSPTILKETEARNSEVRPSIPQALETVVPNASTTENTETDKKSRILGNSIYKGMQGVELLDTTLNDINDQDFQFQADIIHDEKDLADVLAAESIEVIQNGTEGPVSSAYDFTHNDYDVLPPEPRTSMARHAIDAQIEDEQDPSGTAVPNSPIRLLRSNSPLYTYSNRSSTTRNSKHSTHSGDSYSRSPSPPLDVDGEDQEIIDSFSSPRCQSRVPNRTISSSEGINRKHISIPDHSYNMISLASTNSDDNSLEELSIDIPAVDVLMNDVVEEKRGNVRSTRSNTRLPSPDITAFRSDTPKSLKKIDLVFKNSPKASPTGSLKLLSPTVGGGSGTSSARASPISNSASSTTSMKAIGINTSKRRRQESDSSSASKDEISVEDTKTELIDLNSRPGKRRCSENAVELIKACIGIEDNPKRTNSFIKKMEETRAKDRNRKTTATIVEQNESELESIDLALHGRLGSRGSSEDRSSSRGSSVQRSTVSSKFLLREGEFMDDNKSNCKSGHNNSQSKDLSKSKSKIVVGNESSDQKDERSRSTARRSNRTTPGKTKSPLGSAKKKTVHGQIDGVSDKTSSTPTVTSSKNDHLRRKTRSSAAVGLDRVGPSVKRRRISKDAKS